MDSHLMLSPATGLLLLLALSVLWISLGKYWGRKAKSSEGFMLAGRNVGLALGTATAMATWVTSNTTMLAPQFALELGIWGMLAYATASFGLFLFAPLATRIKKLMPSGYTSGDFIRLRYGKNTWYIFLVISLFYGFTWLVSMAMAGGILMYSLAGIPYQFGMSIILGVCVSYTLFGGMYAVIGTDFIQSTIILIGIVVIGCGVAYHFEFTTIHSDLIANRPMLLNLLFPAAIVSIFNNLLFGLGEVFHSNVWWSRAFAMRSGIGGRAYFLAGVLWFPIPIAAGFIALTGDTLGLNIPSPDMAGPMIVSKLFGTVGAMVAFVVFFCSLASSIDSLLAATADLITEDIYLKIINPHATEARVRKTSASIIVFLGVFAWLVCLPRIGTLATVLFFAGPLVASTIWPIVAGLFWRKVPPFGAALAMVLGSAVGLTVYFTIGWYAASLFAAAISMGVVCISRAFWPCDFDWNTLNERRI